MNVQELPTSEIYGTTCTWWGENGWPVVAPLMLPPTGFIVPGMCVGYLYETNSGVALLEWIVGTKNADKAQRSLAIDILIKTMIVSAKERGFKALFTSTKNKSLINRYEKQGFLKTDTESTNLVRAL